MFPEAGHRAATHRGGSAGPGGHGNHRAAAQVGRGRQHPRQRVRGTRSERSHAPPHRRHARGRRQGRSRGFIRQSRRRDDLIEIASPLGVHILESAFPNISKRPGGHVYRTRKVLQKYISSAMHLFRIIIMLWSFCVRLTCTIPPPNSTPCITLQYICYYCRLGRHPHPSPPRSMTVHHVIDVAIRRRVVILVLPVELVVMPVSNMSACPRSHQRSSRVR